MIAHIRGKPLAFDLTTRDTTRGRLSSSSHSCYRRGVGERDESGDRARAQRARAHEQRTQGQQLLRERLPDVRDGLTRVERVVLVTLVERRARVLGREGVPLALLYGRVLERVDVSEAELRAALLHAWAPTWERRDEPHRD